MSVEQHLTLVRKYLNEISFNQPLKLTHQIQFNHFGSHFAFRDNFVEPLLFRCTARKSELTALNTPLAHVTHLPPMIWPEHLLYPPPLETWKHPAGSRNGKIPATTTTPTITQICLYTGYPPNFRFMEMAGLF